MAQKKHEGMMCAVGMAVEDHDRLHNAVKAQAATIARLHKEKGALLKAAKQLTPVATKKQWAILQKAIALCGREGAKQ